ncbi:5-dehydro-2-deoxygluconokinase [Streptomyces tanashiensis]
METEPYDLITMGRLGVDLYPLQTGVGLDRVETFRKFLGGSPANVAVAAARLGRRTALISRTGADPFGGYLRRELKGFDVDDRWVTEVAEHPTPVTFCALFPPDDFPLYFYRRPRAPDLEIRSHELDLDAVRAARVFWATGTGLCAEPSRTATLEALRARSGRGTTVLDLDWRPMFWTDPEAARPHYDEALRHATVAVGNLDELRGRHQGNGSRRPPPVPSSRPARSASPSSNRAPRASSRSPPTGPAPRCRRCRSRSSTGWARATRSAGRSSTACSPAGTSAPSCATPTPPGRSSRAASPAPPPCRTARRSPKPSRRARERSRRRGRDRLMSPPTDPPPSICPPGPPPAVRTRSTSTPGGPDGRTPRSGSSP